MVPYCIEDLKRDPNIESNPNRHAAFRRLWGFGFGLFGASQLRINASPLTPQPTLVDRSNLSLGVRSS